MKPQNLIGIVLCAISFSSQLSAQDKSTIKFGKIAATDFNLSSCKYDSDAAAIVVADVGSSVFEGNNKSGFSIVYNHFKRVRILRKTGFDAATVEIPLYSNGKDEEKLQDLKAVTYNMENGKIISVKLDDKSIFTDKAQKKFTIKKFTFPAVKEGSIIEFSYTQVSDFLFNLQPWEFQGKYPELWSEYEVSIPEYFNYVILSQGYQPFLVKKRETKPEHYKVSINNGADRSETVSLDGDAIVNRWAIRDVPALKEENFTTTVANHISKIEFQLAQIHYPNTIPQNIMGSWTKVSDEMIADETFGADLSRNNGWLDDELKNIVPASAGKLEKAQKVYAFVRDRFACTEHNRLYMTNSLKTVFKNRNGSEAEINLLLTAILKHEGIEASPVILSTRNHGFTNEIYPLMDRFNYVICDANIDNTVFFLDASQPKLGFGNLPDYCYNGHARIINKANPMPVYLAADSLKEEKITSVFIVNDDKIPAMMSGTFQSALGPVDSYSLRNRLGNKDEKELVGDIKSSGMPDLDVTNLHVDSLKQLDNPVNLHYDFSFKHNADDDLIYFNPIMSEAYKENPFKAAERRYPVEMPHRTSDIYVLNMEIPKGYEVDELPKSAKVELNETDGFFEYLIAKDDANIQLRSRIQLNRANFSSDDYNSLREFFGFIVKKQSEQIVFKKKK